MSRPRALVMILAALMAAGIGGYWIGHHGVPSPVLAVATESPRMPSGPIIYYQDPDGKPFYSLEPKQTADGRAYRGRSSRRSRTSRPEARFARASR